MVVHNASGGKYRATFAFPGLRVVARKMESITLQIISSHACGVELVPAPAMDTCARQTPESRLPACLPACQLRDHGSNAASTFVDHSKTSPVRNRFTRCNRACGRRERSQDAAKGRCKHKTFSHLKFLMGASPCFASGSSSFECSWTCTRSRSCTDGFTHLYDTV